MNYNPKPLRRRRNPKDRMDGFKEIGHYEIGVEIRDLDVRTNPIAQADETFPDHLRVFEETEISLEPSF